MNTPAITVTQDSVEIPEPYICPRTGQVGALCGCRRCGGESESRMLGSEQDEVAARIGVELIDAGFAVPRGLGEAVMV